MKSLNFKIIKNMKFKSLFAVALLVICAMFASCATTQQKDKQKGAESSELEMEFDDEFDGEEFGTEASEDEIFEEGGELVLDGDVNDPHHIVISKESMTLNLYDSNGGLIYSFPVAVGKKLGNKREVGDNRTPEGEFKVQQIQDSSAWPHDFGDGKGEIAGAYGPWFIRLQTPPHTGIGIHGTHLPSSIGTRATEGCIRLNNDDLMKLKPLVKVGMSVTIEPSIADQEADGKLSASGVNQETIDDVAADDFFEDAKRNEQRPLGEVEPDNHDESVVEHVIAEGDTFGKLAGIYGTTSKHIQELNPNVDPTKLQIGQKIRVKGSTPQFESNVKEERVEPAAQAVAESGEAVYHIIKDGDYYGKLAEEYGTTSSRIQELNPDLDPRKLQIGQKVRVK